MIFYIRLGSRNKTLLLILNLFISNEIEIILLYIGHGVQEELKFYMEIYIILHLPMQRCAH